MISSETATDHGQITKVRKALTPALAYLRTSAANVGADKDSETRQRQAITAFARSTGFDLVDSFYDEAVSGADHVAARPCSRGDRQNDGGLNLALGIGSQG